MQNANDAMPAVLAALWPRLRQVIRGAVVASTDDERAVLREVMAAGGTFAVLVGNEQVVVTVTTGEDERPWLSVPVAGLLPEPAGPAN